MGFVARVSRIPLFMFDKPTKLIQTYQPGQELLKYRTPAHASEE